MSIKITLPCMAFTPDALGRLLALDGKSLAATLLREEHWSDYHPNGQLTAEVMVDARISGAEMVLEAEPTPEANDKMRDHTMRSLLLEGIVRALRNELSSI